MAPKSGNSKNQEPNSKTDPQTAKSGNSKNQEPNSASVTAADIGLIGLAVMGENLVLNMESHGYTVAVYNRTRARVDDFLAGRAKGKRILGCHAVTELAAALKRPRLVMIMVKAGPAVDQVLEEVVPVLEPGDILIDGGNTHYPDTTRRTRALKDRGLLFIGTGVSGGDWTGLTNSPSNKAFFNGARMVRMPF